MISLLLDILYLGLQDECNNTFLDKFVMTNVYLLDEKKICRRHGVPILMTIHILENQQSVTCTQ